MSSLVMAASDLTPDTGGTSTTPELREIHPTLLPKYVRTIRRPCVLRAIGSDLELSTGLRQGALLVNTKATTKNENEEEEANGVDRRATSTEANVHVGGGSGLEAIRWLARQTGEVKFRVFVSGAVVVAAEETGSRNDKKDADSASGRDISAPATTDSDPTTTPTPISVATFTLDGTDHPDSVLTTSMSRPMTVAEMISCGSEWRSRYLVEDDLPSPTASSPSFGRLVPATPPLPPDVLAAAFGNMGSGADAAPVARQRQLFASVGPCRTQVHRDCFDNLYVCALGERRWSVAPPDDSWEREVGSVSASVAPPPPPSSTSGEGGMGDSATFAHTSLCAGDCIFVPADWWHSVRSGADVSSRSTGYRGGDFCSVAVNWYYDPPPRKDSSNGDDESKEVDEAPNTTVNKRPRVEPEATSTVAEKKCPGDATPASDDT